MHGLKERLNRLIKKISVWIALAALRRAFPECPSLRSDNAEDAALLLLVLPNESSPCRLFLAGDSRQPPRLAAQFQR